MRAMVLGGGFGGIVGAHTLRNELGERHDVTLVSQSGEFYLRAAFPRLAFEGETAPDDIRLPLDEALRPRGIEFKQARVTAIRPDESRVETTAGDVEYDYLIVALGTHYAAERVPGLEEHRYGSSTATRSSPAPRRAVRARGPPGRPRSTWITCFGSGARGSGRRSTC